MSHKIDRLFNVIGRNNDLLEELIKQQRKTNALLVSNQLLTECVSNEGAVRSAEEVAEIVGESFMAALCLSQEMNDGQKEFDYQLQEFYIETEEDEDDDSDDKDNNGPLNSDMKSFD